jgi:amino acid adenylation domain-containing protein
MEKNSSVDWSIVAQNKEDLLAFLLEEEGVVVSPSDTISRRSITTPSQLSFAQERMWFLYQLEPDNPFYNNSAILNLEGFLNIEVLERSVNEIVLRHEILRTSFVLTNNQPTQIVAPNRITSIPVEDLQKLSSEVQQVEVNRLVKKEAQQSFSLDTDSLLRTKLLRLGQQSHVFILTIHHIISDGWSIGLFVQELAALYESFLTKATYPLVDLPIQYADFAEWHRHWLQGDRLKQQLDYWKQQLAGVPPVLQMPTDHQRPSVQTFRGNIEKFYIDRELTQQLKQICQTTGTTLFMVLLTAFSILLHRYSGQDDIVIGSPIANRNRVEIEKLIGFFANTIALRVQISGNSTYLDLLDQVKEVALAAYSHQDLPFEILVDELKIERHLSHNALFQIVFALQNNPLPSIKLPNLELSSDINFDNGTVRFDLEVHLWESAEGLKGNLVYSTDLFDSLYIKRLIGNFQVLLGEIVKNPQQSISVLPILTAAERYQLLVEWNQTKTLYPRDRTIQEIFEEQVETNPHSVAIIFQEQQLTYQQLNQRANQLARYLQKLGVSPNVLVGIYIERSTEMLVGLLGILKAGGAYLPIDPSYPQERLEFMIQDAQIQVILTLEKFVPKLNQGSKVNNGLQVVCLDSDWLDIEQELDSNLNISSTSKNLAYVEYTSGSTGNPKGVCIVHQGVVRLAKNTNYYNFSNKEVFLQLAPLSFDASTFEIWGSLLNGSKLVIMPAHTPSLIELGQAIRDYQVTTLWLTSGLFSLMVDERIEDLQLLRYLLAGGDALSVPHVQKLLKELKHTRLINGYGPTENTTFTCCYAMTGATQLNGSVPIGRPIANSQVYILDLQLQPVPIGVSGELYIGGDGLAQGYLNNSTLTAEKFITNPFDRSNSEYLYRTGDLARYCVDGNIEFIGRIDFQVKIRGFRIELNEIEAVLAQHPDVREVLVLAREDRLGSKQLVAYVVPQDTLGGNKSLVNLSLRDTLRDFLRAKLPDYMVPSSMVILEAMPLTANGKIDRKQLPPSDGNILRDDQDFVAPSSPLETKIAHVWSQLLGLDRVDIHDNFFDIGGNSLLVIQVHTKLQEILGQDISIVNLFRYPTINVLTQFLNQDKEIEPQTIEKSRDRADKQKEALKRNKLMNQRRTGK